MRQFLLALTVLENENSETHKGKQRHAQDHTTGKQTAQYLTPGRLALESTCFTVRRPISLSVFEDK